MIIAPVVPASLSANASQMGFGSSSGNLSFGKFLENAIGQVNSLSGQADVLSASYASGGPVTVDELMIAEQKATLALDTVVQVRDRVVNAYQTIMNMQV